MLFRNGYEFDFFYQKTIYEINQWAKLRNLLYCVKLPCNEKDQLQLSNDL